MKPLLIIGTVTALLIVMFALTATVPTYRVSPVFLIPLTFVPILLRRQLNLSPVHYMLYCIAVLLHTSGAWGYYQRSPFPFSFDIAVHFYFAFAGAFLVHQAIKHHVPLKNWQLNLTVVLFMMGIGALHEIMEYSSYLMLGEERGMLKPKTSYFFDTQRDLLNNLLGTILALVLCNLTRVWLNRPARDMDVRRDADRSNDPSPDTAPWRAAQPES
jgi:uncharacterized membrane protein YjdF